MTIITSHHDNTIDAYASHEPGYADEYRQLARRIGSLLRESAEMRTKALNLDTRGATDEQAEQVASLWDRIDAFAHQVDVLARKQMDLYESLVALVEASGERVDG